MRYKMTVAYDGTDFSGWQIQNGKRTVQGEIEKALYDLTGEKTRITGSGRTDTGVHAVGQVVHFDSDTSIPEKRLYKAINAHLPKDIRVLSCDKTEEDFNACRSAKRKTYKYKMYVAETPLPTKDRYALCVLKTDFEKMKSVCSKIEGTHDFKAFSSTGSSATTSVRTIYSCLLESKGQDIVLTVCGNGFLYNMVRIIAGTILEIGMGRRSEEDIEKAFSTQERKYAGKTLDAKGLCLEKVEYL